jgi:hypothetical protein
LRTVSGCAAELQALLYYRDVTHLSEGSGEAIAFRRLRGIRGGDIVLLEEMVEERREMPIASKAGWKNHG